MRRAVVSRPVSAETDSGYIESLWLSVGCTLVDAHKSHFGSQLTRRDLLEIMLANMTFALVLMPTGRFLQNFGWSLVGSVLVGAAGLRMIHSLFNGLAAFAPSADRCAAFRIRVL